jgi:hypothetical protein
MKKVTLLCALLLAVSASIASAAAGVNLRWAACLGDGGAANKAFACNSNTLSGGTLVGSSISAPLGCRRRPGRGRGRPASASSPLPAWWQFTTPARAQRP